MKKIKYFIFFILVSIIGSTSVFAAALSVSANKTTVVVGNNVTITVSASGAAGWEYCLSYDSSIFELTSTTSDTGGACVLTGSTLTGYSKVTYTLKAKKSGTSTITLRSNNMYGDDGLEVAHNVGSVKLTAKTQAEIEASYSTNADLKTLSIEGYEITPSFDKNVLNYQLEVENEVEKVTIKAGKADSRASMTGIGEKELTEGLNKFEVVVTAEKGNKKVYVIEVTRKELNPIHVNVDGNNYTLVRKSEALTAPTYYSSTEIEIQGELIPAFKSDITGFVLVGLKYEDGTIKLYRYDEVNEKYNIYQQLNTESVILIPIKTDKKINEYDLTKTITINNEDIIGYVGDKKSDFALVYGMNASNGEESWYKYDIKEGTLQRYEEIEVKEENDKLNIYLVSTIVFVGLSFITIILVIVLISMNSKLRKKNNKLVRMIESTKEKKVEVIIEEKVNEKDLKVDSDKTKVNDIVEVENEPMSKREQRRLEREKELEQQRELRSMQEDFLKTEANQIIVDDVELEETAPTKKRKKKK